MSSFENKALGKFVTHTLRHAVHRNEVELVDDGIFRPGANGDGPDQSGFR